MQSLAPEFIACCTIRFYLVCTPLHAINIYWQILSVYCTISTECSVMGHKRLWIEHLRCFITGHRPLHWVDFCIIQANLTQFSSKMNNFGTSHGQISPVNLVPKCSRASHITICKNANSSKSQPQSGTRRNFGILVKCTFQLTFFWLSIDFQLIFSWPSADCS
jgi:hypothetical protein